jgi:hypothetical protein
MKMRTQGSLDSDDGRPAPTFLASSARIHIADRYSGDPSILETSTIVTFTNLTAVVLNNALVLV